MSRRFSDLENEAFVDELIKQLTQTYGAAREEIMAKLGRAGLAQLEENRRTSALLRQIREIVDQLDAAAGKFATDGIERAYRAGQNIAGEVLDELGVTERPDWDARIHTDAVNVIARQMAADALEKNGTVYSNVARALRTTKQNVIAEQQINEQIAQGILQGETRRQTSRRISQQLIDELGEGKLVTAGSRQFRPEDYAELLARTRTREAVTNGIINSAGQVGIDLFQVSVHDNPCPACLPYQGRVFSRSGTHGEFPPLTTQPPFHPRCKHVLVPVTENHLKRRGQYDALVALSKDPQINVAGAADYNEALTGEAPTPARGSGPNVSKVMSYPKKSRIEPVAKRTLAAIDNVHSDGKLPVTDLDGDTPLTRGNGEFEVLRGGKINIRVNPLGETKHMTLAHEIGHFLDYSGTEPAGAFASAKNPAFAPLMKALSDTRAVKRLEKMAYGAGVIKISGPSGPILASVDQNYVEYLLSPHEQFARAYAQYIATRSGDQVMLGELAKRRGGRRPGVLWYPFQWSDNDFAPVAEAMDALFKEMGWIS